MGNNLLVGACCGSKTLEIFKEQELKQYKANSDIYLLQLEEKYNLLQYISFDEYIENLKEFNQEGKQISEQMEQNSINHYEIWEEYISINSYVNFINEKIIQNTALYNFRIEKNKRTINVFIDILIEMYENLQKNFLKYSQDKEKIIRKFHLLALGFLYCKASLYYKTETFFKIFKNKQNEFTQTKNLSLFLISLFLIPSCCLVFVRMKLGIKYRDFGEIGKSDVLGILSAFELIDIERLITIFYQNFFTEKEALDHEEYLLQFAEKECGWLFKGSGVRLNLEQNNIEDENSLVEEKESIDSD